MVKRLICDRPSGSTNSADAIYCWSPTPRPCPVQSPAEPSNENIKRLIDDITEALSLQPEDVAVLVPVAPERSQSVDQDWDLQTPEPERNKIFRPPAPAGPWPPFPLTAAAESRRSSRSAARKTVLTPRRGSVNPADHRYIGRLLGGRQRFEAERSGAHGTPRVALRCGATGSRSSSLCRISVLKCFGARLTANGRGPNGR